MRIHIPLAPAVALALFAMPALAQETEDTPYQPLSETPPATIDSDGDGTADAWDRDGDGRADAWDTDGDGQPDTMDDDGDGQPDMMGDHTDGDAAEE